jgi:hypothetical protein
MFEHICHIMANGSGQEVSRKIALSLVHNYWGLLLKHVKQNDFVTAYFGQQHGYPTLFELDVHAGTKLSGNLIAPFRTLCRTLEPLPDRKEHLTCTLRKPPRVLTTKATIDADMADPLLPLYHA